MESTTHRQILLDSAVKDKPVDVGYLNWSLQIMLLLWSHQVH